MVTTVAEGAGIDVYLPSLKLTASLHLKMDGWKSILFFWVSGTFQVRTVSFRESKYSIHMLIYVLFIDFDDSVWFDSIVDSIYAGRIFLSLV